MSWIIRILFGQLCGFSVNYDSSVDYDYNEEEASTPTPSLYDTLANNPKAIKDLMRLKVWLLMSEKIDLDSERVYDVQFTGQKQ